MVNRDPIPATVLYTELPPALDYIISRAIAKDRSQRYQRGMEMVLDIQELRAGREPWSKTKEPVSAVAGQTEDQTSRDSTSRPISAVALRKSRAQTKQQEHSAAVALLKKMRNEYFAANVLLIGLLIFGLRVRQFLPHRPVSAGSLSANALLTPQPAATRITTVKIDSEPAKTTARNNLGVKTSLSRNVDKPTKAVGGSHPASAKPARATPQAAAASPAMLEIEVEHKFTEAQLSIWVDDNLSFTHQLEGAEKKHLVVFHRVQGHDFHAMQVTPGKHSLRVQVTAEAGKFYQSATVAGDFSVGAEKMLRVQFSKSGQMSVTLE